MSRNLIHEVIDEYYRVLENNITEFHYIETDFPSYSKLVTVLIDGATKHIKKPVFFTALCLPPFQWFNFRLNRKDVLRATDLVQASFDPIWGEYLSNLNSRRESNLYRCIFCVKDDVTIKDDYKLLNESVFKNQFRASLIHLRPKNGSTRVLQPLSTQEIKDNIAVLHQQYPAYSSCNKAYLVIDSDNRTEVQATLNPNYDILSLKMVFVDYFHKSDGHAKKLVMAQDKYDSWTTKKMPEDFFLVGEENGPKKTWKLGLAADVSEDFKKVRLWIISEHIDAFEITTEGKSSKFNFRQICDFVDEIITENLWQPLW